jgi:hypothetical protein
MDCAARSQVSLGVAAVRPKVGEVLTRNRIRGWQHIRRVYPRRVDAHERRPHCLEPVDRSLTFTQPVAVPQLD